jgi:hypothetical protein
MEESISGFKVRGDWGDVVEHGERMTLALRESGLGDTEAFEEWDEWRPKHHERLGDDVSEKTAEQASVAEGEGEKEGTTPEEDVQRAGEKLAESYEKLEEEEADAEEAVEKWEESVEHVARAADTAGRRALRKVEDAVYRRVMTPFTPYYFDNELVSANISKAGDDGDYVFEVNVNDDDLKETARDRLGDYETDVERWHVDTEKDLEGVEAAEGHEPPESKHEARYSSN